MLNFSDHQTYQRGRCGLIISGKKERRKVGERGCKEGSGGAKKEGEETKGKENKKMVGRKGRKRKRRMRRKRGEERKGKGWKRRKKKS